MTITGKIGSARIALAHEWLVAYAGSEKVVEEILNIFPFADLFSLVVKLSPELDTALRQKRVETSFLQRLPLAATHFRLYLPLMPLAIEQFDLSDYDIVISSNHAVAKGVLVGPDQLHISYVHSPMRYAWDLQHQYLANMSRWSPIAALTKLMLHRLRTWDARSANGVDAFVANSRYIARRIRKAYRREATVIYPPVDIDAFQPQETKESYYVTAARLVPYKRVDLVVRAFGAMPEQKLVVIGDGPELTRIRANASKNIDFISRQSRAEFVRLLQGAKAFVYAGAEDFGITLAEAQAAGTPVIAYERGGAGEIVRDLATPRPTGVLFSRQCAEDICAAVQVFENHRDTIEPFACRENALRFGTERFRLQFEDFVRKSWTTFEEDRKPGQR